MLIETKMKVSEIVIRSPRYRDLQIFVILK